MNKAVLMLGLVSSITLTTACPGQAKVRLGMLNPIKVVKKVLHVTRKAAIMLEYYYTLPQGPDGETIRFYLLEEAGQ